MLVRFCHWPCSPASGLAARVLAYRVASQPEASGDLAQTQPLLDLGTHRDVGVTEPVEELPRRVGLTQSLMGLDRLGRRVRRLPLLRLGRRLNQVAQQGAVAGDEAFDGLDQVVPDMPFVCAVLGIRGTGEGAVGEDLCTVSADDLGTGVLAQPRGDAVRVTVGQQIHGLVGLAVDQDGAVTAALPRGEVANSSMPRTRGVAQAGSGSAIAKRRTVVRLTAMPSSSARRTTARAARRTPSAASIRCRTGVRRP